MATGLEAMLYATDYGPPHDQLKKMFVRSSFTKLDLRHHVGYFEINLEEKIECLQEQVDSLKQRFKEAGLKPDEGLELDLKIAVAAHINMSYQVSIH